MRQGGGDLGSSYKKGRIRLEIRPLCRLSSAAGVTQNETPQFVICRYSRPRPPLVDSTLNVFVLSGRMLEPFSTKSQPPVASTATVPKTGPANVGPM